MTNSVNIANLAKFMNKNIQLSPKSIKEVLNNCANKKMLVFGLGYDSELWYNATNFNTYFVEHDQKYIKLNKNIDAKHIIYHNYIGINVKSSFNLTEDQIKDFVIPDEILKNAPYDIILIDGPPGYNDNLPGRLLPIYWSKTLLSKPNTIIYIDDSNRKLENYCINKFFKEYNMTYFDERDGFMKIIVD